MTHEFDRQLLGNASLACKICVVLRHYDCNRPILTNTRTFLSPIRYYLEPLISLDISLRRNEGSIVWHEW